MKASSGQQKRTTGNEQEFMMMAHSYAVVPTADGWLIFQL
jgi:hypothetical protein